MSTDGQGTKRRRNIPKNLNRLSRAHERYRRQTDGRAIACSERERELTFAKNLSNSNISSRCFHNMANFGPLTAEIGWRVWGTPANFNEFRVLASLRRSPEVNQTLQNLWPSPGLVHCIYIFGGSCPVTEFFQVQNSLFVDVLRSPILHRAAINNNKTVDHADDKLFSDRLHSKQHVLNHLLLGTTEISVKNDTILSREISSPK